MAGIENGSNSLEEQLNGEEEVFGHHPEGSEAPLDDSNAAIQAPIDPMEMFGAFIRQMERINAPRAAAPTANTLVTKFKSLKPEKFLGTADSAKAERWIQHLEDIFEVLDCTEIEKRKLAVFQLVDDARSWWELVKSVLGAERTQILTWREFKEKFMDKYFPASEREKMEMAFMTLSQGTMNVTEYQNRFEALSRFAPHLIGTPERRARKFARGLVSSIRRMVIVDRRKTYEEIVEAALTIEEDICMFKREMGNVNKGKGYEAPRGNRNLEGMQPAKKQKISDYAPNHGHASGSSSQNGLKCFNCGGRGHTRPECTSARNAHVKCFNCGNMGHFSGTCTKPRRNNKPVNAHEGRVNAIIYEQPST